MTTEKDLTRRIPTPIETQEPLQLMEAAIKGIRTAYEDTPRIVEFPDEEDLKVPTPSEVANEIRMLNWKAVSTTGLIEGRPVNGSKDKMWFGEVTENKLYLENLGVESANELVRIVAHLPDPMRNIPGFLFIKTKNSGGVYCSEPLFAEDTSTKLV